MNAETRRVLQDARRLIIERGWAPYPSLGVGGSSFCLGLAICNAARDSRRLIADAVEELGFPFSGDCYVWNDRQPSVEPVIALLDKVLAESGRGMVSEENSGQAGSGRHETPRPELQVVA